MSGFGFTGDPSQFGGQEADTSSSDGGGSSSSSNSGETSDEAKKSFIEQAKEMEDQTEDETLQGIIQQLIADGEYTADGGALALGGVLAEQFGKQLERFQNDHSLIAYSGILYSEQQGELYNYTENFSYDPIRSSVGSIWSKTPNDTIRYPNSVFGALNGASGEFNKLLNLTEEEIQDTVGPSGIPFGYKYLPKVKFKFNNKMQNWGVTHMMFGKPATPDQDDDAGIKCRVLDIGQVQYMYLYFDLNGYDDYFKPIVPFNMLFSAKHKLEGYSYKSSLDPTKFKTLKFDAVSGGSSTKFDASFISKGTADLEKIQSIAANGVEIIEGTHPNVNQEAVIDDLESKLYIDEVFSSKAAISEEAVPFFGSEGLQGELLADVKPVYNFFSPKWEYASKALTEKMVGNIYSAADWKNKIDWLPLHFDFEKFANSFIVCDNDPETYKNTAQVKRTNNIIINQDSLLLDTVEDLKEQFPMYNEIVFSAIPQGNLGKIFQESGMTTEFLKTLLSYFYNDYNPPSAEKIFQIAKVLGFALQQPSIVYPQDATFISKIKEPASIDLFTDDQKTIQTQDDVVTFDFLAWLEYYINEINGNVSNNEFKLYDETYKSYTNYFGDKDFQNLFKKKSGLSFKKVLGLVKFLASAKNNVKNNFRAYHDILGGKKATSDILYYRIEKRSQKTGNVIQNFFVMPQEIDPDKGFQSQIKVIDTQVRYAQAYRYEIYAVKVVVGTEYKILTAPDEAQLPLFEANLFSDTTSNSEQVTNPPLTIYQRHLATGQSNLLNLYPMFSLGNNNENGSENNYVMPIKLSLRPTVKICEVPLYKEQDVLILDNPPMPPLVNVYPLNGKKNNILLTLETQTGDRELTPIPIETADTTYFVTERFSQKRDISYPGGGYVYPTLRFKSDDDSSSYQIYRLEGTPPKSYSSFRGNLYQALDKMAKIPQAGFEDTIKVNTKYYYLFRSVDMHGNVSNPSPIYEVEMVEASDGVFYPIIKVMDIDEIQASSSENEVTDMTSTTKTLKKTSYIFPAEQQLELNEEASNIDGSTANVPTNDPVLGIASETIWGKKFKFRLVSRHTGRAIDVNVDFNKEHTKPQQATEPCFVVEEE